MDDEKEDENPIDVSEVGPCCILLVDFSIIMKFRMITTYVHILVLEAYISFVDAFPMFLSEKLFPFLFIQL